MTRDTPAEEPEGSHVVGVEFLKKYVWSSPGEGARDEALKGHDQDVLRVFLSGNGVKILPTTPREAQRLDGRDRQHR